uniref:N-acetyltransferase domain-containing protein n=1 Tax=Tetradesmus obliquus TaxID=3088 RepID=A0A383W7M9_TETOB|eukprot:jgi/Sobl393_1/15834/SZX73638.1
MHVLPLDKHSASSCTARHKLQRGVAAPAGPCLPQEQRKQQQSRHRCVTLAAVDASKLLVLASTPQEYFPAADLHATCFDHPRDASAALWARFERVWALQINDDLARRGVGNCKLLIAYDPEQAPADIQARAAAAAAVSAQADISSSNGTNGSSSSSSSSSIEYALPATPDYAFPALGYWLSRMVERPVWPGLGASFQDLGIVGVAQVDSFGDIIPPRTLNASRDGAVGWVKREGFAYISNVAVAPQLRRSGIAQRLMAEAESLAATWGCSKAGLHCNPSNQPAMALYRRLRYKNGPLEAPWMPYLQGRAPDRCYLMLKRIRQQQQQEQQHQQQQHSQQQQQQQQQAGTAAVGTPAAQQC